MHLNQSREQSTKLPRKYWCYSNKVCSEFIDFFFSKGLESKKSKTRSGSIRVVSGKGGQ